MQKSKAAHTYLVCVTLLVSIVIRGAKNASNVCSLESIVCVCVCVYSRKAFSVFYHLFTPLYVFIVYQIHIFVNLLLYFSTSST